MPKFRLIAVSMVMLMAFVHSVEVVRAQAPAVQDAVLAEIRVSVVRAIGAQDQTVEISVTGNTLTVLRLNSNMNEATHGGRDNEAAAIASIVSKTIADEPKFRSLTAIRVQYVARTSPTATSTVVDTVDFRKDPQGVFQLHRT